MKYLSIIISVFLLSSCLRLDDNFYNLEDKITEYKLDNYTGEQDFILDNSYQIIKYILNRNKNNIKQELSTLWWEKRFSSM